MGDVISLEEAATRYISAQRVERCVVGLDIGKVSDHSALSATHHLVEPLPNEWEEINSGWRQRARTTTTLRLLKRFELGMPYPEQITLTSHLLARLPVEPHRITLVLDSTGVGEPIADLFDAVEGCLSPIRVVITGGMAETQVGDRRWHVAKSVLVSHLESALHTRELKFATGLEYGEELRRELANFERRVTASGMTTFSARVGEHDDLVLSLCLCAWELRRRHGTFREIKLTGW